MGAGRPHQAPGPGRQGAALDWAPASPALRLIRTGRAGERAAVRRPGAGLPDASPVPSARPMAGFRPRRLPSGRASPRLATPVLIRGSGPAGTPSPCEPHSVLPAVAPAGARERLLGPCSCVTEASLPQGLAAHTGGSKCDRGQAKAASPGSLRAVPLPRSRGRPWALQGADASSSVRSMGSGGPSHAFSWLPQHLSP